MIVVVVVVLSSGKYGVIQGQNTNQYYVENATNVPIQNQIFLLQNIFF